MRTQINGSGVFTTAVPDVRRPAEKDVSRRISPRRAVSMFGVTEMPGYRRVVSRGDHPKI
jgi:hypothetical protein